MSNCPIASWIILKESEKNLRDGVKGSFYNLLINQVKDYLCQQLGLGQQLVFDSGSMIESAIIGLENAVAFAAEPREWACFVLDEQVLIMEDALSREISLLDNIINRLDGIQRKVKKDKNVYTKMSRTMHRWLQSSYRDLEDCVRNSENVPIFKQGFLSSYNKMQMIKMMLDVGTGRVNVNALLGGIKREFGDLIENKGDPIRKIDHGAVIRGVIDAQKKDFVDAINFIDDWIYFLNKYVRILDDYMGCDLSAFFNPFISNLEMILRNAKNEQTSDWSIKSLTSGVDWSKCISEITVKSVFPGKSENTVIGNHNIYKGSKYIIDNILFLIVSAEKSVGPVTTDTNKLFDAAQSLINDDIFEQIREDGKFTSIGKDSDGDALVDDRPDKLRQLLKTNKILLDYKLIEGVTLSHATTALATKDFLDKLLIAMNDLSSVDDGKIELLMRRKTPYDDNTVKEFMEAAMVRGLSSVVEFGARTAIGKMDYDNVQKHKYYFEVRRAILMEYRSIIRKIPTYKNSHINELIETLKEFGFDTLAQNLKQGVSLFDQTPLASAIGLSAESIMILSTLYKCLDLAKTPQQLKVIAKLTAQIEVDLKVTEKCAIEKGINGILKVTGVTFDWIKRMLSKSDESDILLARVKYIKGLMETAL